MCLTVSMRRQTGGLTLETAGEVMCGIVAGSTPVLLTSSHLKKGCANASDAVSLLLGSTTSSFVICI